MLVNKEGQRIPSVTFPVRHNDQWQNIDSEHLFAGKTVAVFSLPGAFTPTCSSTHLPRYNELAGVSLVFCFDGFTGLCAPAFILLWPLGAFCQPL